MTFLEADIFSTLIKDSSLRRNLVYCFLCTLGLFFWKMGLKSKIFHPLTAFWHGTQHNLKILQLFLFCKRWGESLEIHWKYEASFAKRLMVRHFFLLFGSGRNHFLNFWVKMTCFLKHISNESQETCAYLKVVGGGGTEAGAGKKSKSEVRCLFALGFVYFFKKM